MLVVFSYSLVVPPINGRAACTHARANLPVVAISYTRRVTQIWCAFFVVNGAIAFVTAMWASEAIWSIYTGVVSYFLMGLLFGIEFLFRLRFKRRHHV